MRRLLRRLGCTFEEGTRHTIVRFGGKRSLIPRHPSAEVKTGTVEGIFKQLGLKRRD
ncbi:MAG: type II toxin-antitoxin system HicA family toxin [Acidobacteria bacterium]|nr:type II toxin-antitoxin system HicA family toxin [Acidobacteriota bacterium]